MKVRAEKWGNHEGGMDVIVVRLDSGKEVGSFCIVHNAKTERLMVYNMIRACIREAMGGSDE